jgi:hypothetical protein
MNISMARKEDVPSADDDPLTNALCTYYILQDSSLASSEQGTYTPAAREPAQLQDSEYRPRL